MDNKAFVFTGFAFLLVVPAIILAAALANMMYYGSTGIAISMAGDEVFYSCQNMLDFLEDGSRDGQRDYVLEQAALYASEHGLNFTNATINTTFFQIVFESPGGLTCNKTVELRLGTLLLNLTLSDWNATEGGVPVYFRKTRNNFVNVTANVTYSNNTCVPGASVILDILGLTTSMNQTTCGIYTNLTNITALVDSTDECTRKSLLGSKTADATTNRTDWYDGSDSESFLILGDMIMSTVEGVTSGKGNNLRLGVTTTLVDEYGDPVTEYFFDSPDTPNCNQNYTMSMPNITISIYEGSVDDSNLQGTFVSPINISEDEPPKDSGVYATDSGVSFTLIETYLAVVSVSSPDYLTFNWQGEITFSDLEASSIYDDTVEGMDAQNEECKFTGSPLGQGIVLNITNVGTTGSETIDNLSVVYKYCDAVGCSLDNVSTYKAYGTGVYDYPGGRAGRGGNWLVCERNISVALAGGNRIFANITSVNSPNIDNSLTNNIINGTV